MTRPALYMRRTESVIERRQEQTALFNTRANLVRADMRATARAALINTVAKAAAFGTVAGLAIAFFA